MHSFKDAKGRKWDVKLDGWQLVKIQERFKADLKNPEHVVQVSKNFALVIQIVYVLCEEQAKQRKVTEQDFCKSLDNRAIDEAAEAYIGEVIPFLPLVYRELMTEVMDATAKVKRKFATRESRKLLLGKVREAANLDSLLPGNGTGKRSGKSRARSA